MSIISRLKTSVKMSLIASLSNLRNSSQTSRDREEVILGSVVIYIDIIDVARILIWAKNTTKKNETLIP